jgi:hypothetical protein
MWDWNPYDAFARELLSEATKEKAKEVHLPKKEP